MMRKHLLLWVMAIICIFPFTLNAIDTDSQTQEVDNSSGSKIATKGELDSGQLRSGGDALTAEIDGSTILLTFNNNVGNVLVRITNRYGNTVHSSIVNSNSGYAVISLSGLPSGTYTITFSNGNGTMWGQFILN